jgi:hypothetical protein
VYSQYPMPYPLPISLVTWCLLWDLFLLLFTYWDNLAKAKS